MAASSSAVQRRTPQQILFSGEIGEEALDLVEPGGRFWRVVKLSARRFGEPVSDRLGLMAGHIVNDDVNVEISGTLASTGFKMARNSRARW
jgi:hypothetical protein